MSKITFLKDFELRTNNGDEMETNPLFVIKSPVNSSLYILNWLYQEECNDISVSPLSNNADLIAQHERRLRFIGRMTNFTVIFCNVDGILKKGYENLLAFVGSDQQGIASDRKWEDVRNKWEKMRNKIFAHSSFENPKYRGGQDSKSLQLTSLSYLSGELINGSMNKYSIAGGSYRKSIYESSCQLVDVDLEECSIVNDYNEIDWFFSEWDKKFTSIISQYKHIVIPPPSKEI